MLRQFSVLQRSADAQIIQIDLVGKACLVLPAIQPFASFKSLFWVGKSLESLLEQANGVVHYRGGIVITKAKNDDDGGNVFDNIHSFAPRP
jgi:hypothetical protein